jgi:nucleoside-diphosphate-sugar epimerase
VARFLLTGAAGFIGARVAARLLDQGHAVVGVDNLNDAYDPALKEWRLARLRDRAGFQFVRGDIADPNQLDAAWGTQPYDGVINLAARAGVRQSTRDPLAYCEANVVGALRLLERARHAGVPHFVQASSSSVYGARNPLPYREDADISRPLSPYAATKGAAELLCHSYHALHGLNITVLRFFTVYGPAGRPDMSIFRFVQWIVEGKPIRIHGDGLQERDFTFVEDVARGTVAALALSGYDVVNLGGDRPVSLQTVIALLEQRVGRPAAVENGPPAPADVRATWADIQRARSRLGWSPETPLEDGLAACVDWYLREREWARRIDTRD